MKQLLQNLKDGKAVVLDVPAPTPLAGQALVRTAASLVSAGTERMVVSFAEKSLLGKARSRPDLARQVIEKARREGALPTLRAAFNRLDEPMALGYSSAGVIVRLGEGMEGFHVGQRVACAGGGYAVHAEYAAVPRALLTPLPDSVDFETAAFTTLGAIALHGFRLAEPQLGETIAVIGLGLLGLLTIQIAAAAGCRVLGIDIAPDRVQRASALGHQACSRQDAESAAQAFTANRGFDAVLICADTPSEDPVALAGALARDRGRVVAVGAVGLTLPRKIYYEKELSFINSRSYGPGRYDSSYEEEGHDYPLGYVRWTEGRNFEAMVELFASGKVKTAPLVTHRIPIERAAEAYEVITGKRKEPFLGVLLTYPSEQKSAPKTRIPFSRNHPPEEAPCRLGVIGAGLFANATLLPALTKVQGISLIGIASRGGLHAAHSAKKFGFAYAASNAEEILNDETINTVAILTRHDEHTSLLLRALRAGKRVLVEKPLAISPEELDELETYLSENESTPMFSVGFNRRFAPLAQKLAAFFEGRAEPLSVHYRVNAGYLPLNHWLHDPKQGGGRIIGEGCHFIDFAAFLAGAPPVSVFARALPDGGKYREDNVSMSFAFPDGSFATIEYLANGDKSYPKERVEVFCGGKIAVLEDFRRLEVIANGRRKTYTMAQDKGWRSEWESFVRASQQGGAPPIPYDHLFGVTRASFAAVRSLREKQEISL